MKIVYIDMDGVLADFNKSHTQKLIDEPRIQFPQCQYGFFRNLEVIEHSVNVCKLLLSCPVFDPYILTAPSKDNPFCYTEKRVWVEENMGREWVDRLIISPHKHLNIGDFLIDDRDKGNGQDKFKGKLIHFGSSEFPDWFKVEEFFFDNLEVF